MSKRGYYNEDKAWENKVITINVSTKLLKAIGLIMKSKNYPSRSEVVRMAIRNFVYDELVLNKILDEVDELIELKSRSGKGGRHQKRNKDIIVIDGVEYWEKRKNYNTVDREYSNKVEEDPLQPRGES